MRNVFWQISSTLDGYMEDADGNLDLTAEVVDEKYQAYATAMLESIDAFIIGRKTYEVFVSYWPKATGRQADILNALPKYVVSTTLEKVEWNNGSLIRDDAAEEIEKLKGQSGRDIALFGSATLASSLLGSGVIDECRIMVTPFILGSGKRTFGDSDRHAFSLTSTETWPSGTVYSTYRPSERS